MINDNIEVSHTQGRKISEKRDSSEDNSPQDSNKKLNSK
jgi:hypothetical protein